MGDDRRLPESAVIGECWARDGLQNEAAIVPVEQKVEIISGLVAAGFRKIEATSFAHPKYLPQFLDAEEVLRRIPRTPGVEYRGLCTRMKGVERAIRSKEEGAGVDELELVLAASEAYNLVNVKMTRDENMKAIEPMAKAALASGHVLLGWVATSFGCPISGDVPAAQVVATARWWKELGARFVGFGDTTGSANPRQVSRFLEHLFAEGFTAEGVVVHFHDTRGWGIANCLVALAHGVRYFDTSLGAIGGQPKTGAAAYQRGYSGNACTEDLVGMLDEMGVNTGIDLPKLLRLGRRAEEVLGRRLRSNFLEAGPVPHAGVVYDKERGILSSEG